mmetsp:Transcript_1839/g.2649  ORF Transcript_1839/g.2649 Transcript_1839/m.2649 type:complete len:267 (-) Transcript_1839:588-1388(-)
MPTFLLQRRLMIKNNQPTPLYTILLTTLAHLLLLLQMMSQLLFKNKPSLTLSHLILNRHLPIRIVPTAVKVHKSSLKTIRLSTYRQQKIPLLLKTKSFCMNLMWISVFLPTNLNRSLSRLALINPNQAVTVKRRFLARLMPNTILLLQMLSKCTIAVTIQRSLLHPHLLHLRLDQRQHRVFLHLHQTAAVTALAAAAAVMNISMKEEISLTGFAKKHFQQVQVTNHHCRSQVVQVTSHHHFLFLIRFVIHLALLRPKSHQAVVQIL